MREERKCNIVIYFPVYTGRKTVQTSSENCVYTRRQRQSWLWNRSSVYIFYTFEIFVGHRSVMHWDSSCVCINSICSSCIRNCNSFFCFFYLSVVVVSRSFDAVKLRACWALLLCETNVKTNIQLANKYMIEELFACIECLRKNKIFSR